MLSKTSLAFRVSEHESSPKTSSTQNIIVKKYWKLLSDHVGLSKTDTAVLILLMPYYLRHPWVKYLNNFIFSSGTHLAKVYFKCAHGIWNGARCANKWAKRFRITLISCISSKKSFLNLSSHNIGVLYATFLLWQKKKKTEGKKHFKFVAKFNQAQVRSQARQRWFS